MTASQAIRRLWDLLPHTETALGPTTVRWFAKSLDGRVKWGGFADTFDELWNAACHCPGMNFYVCPNPSDSRTGVRHSTKDVTHWSWLLIDVDPVVKEDYDPTLLMAAALAKLGKWLERDFTVHRPVVIDSGRGMQAWFRLDDILLDDGLSDGRIASTYRVGFGTCRAMSRRTARLTMRYWLERLATELGEMNGCQIDTTCSDLPRPMRCPGTVNVKTNRMADFVSDSDYKFGGIVSLADTLVNWTPEKQFKRDPVPSAAAGTEWQDVLVHLTIKAQNYLQYGRTEPGRHEHMWHTARTLAERGLSRDAVRRGLQWGNTRRGPDMELKPEDIEHALNTAFNGLTPGAE